MHFDAPHGNLIRPTILAHLSFSPLYSKCSQIFYGMHLILPTNAGGGYMFKFRVFSLDSVIFGLVCVPK
jgi:hypothetical protein